MQCVVFAVAPVAVSVAIAVVVAAAVFAVVVAVAEISRPSRHWRVGFASRFEHWNKKFAHLSLLMAM